MSPVVRTGGVILGAVIGGFVLGAAILVGASFLIALAAITLRGGP